MIEQICVVKEINCEKISTKKIVEAMIESHNVHVGSKVLEIDGLNMNNEGLLKVFSTGRKYGGLAKKYNYYFLLIRKYRFSAFWLRSSAENIISSLNLY